MHQPGAPMSVVPDTVQRFETAEYEQRLARTRVAMEARGIEVLIVTDPSNMSWLTGYDGWSFYTHQAVVVDHHRPPLWWGRTMDARGARRTVYMAHEHIVGYPDELVQSTTAHPHSHLAEVLKDRGNGGARVGVEMDNYYYNAAAHLNLSDGLPGALFVDATGLVNWQRAVKSPRELDYMRKAAQIVERIHERIFELIEPGMRKSDLVAEIFRAGIRGVDGEDGFGGDYPAIVPLVPSGVDASAPHLTWDDERFATGAATFFEVAGCYRRYHAPLCRTVHLGDPPDAMRRAEAALIAGLEAGLEAARAGNRACDVADALFTRLEAAGIDKEGRCGYAVGLSYPPDWGERTISFRRSDRTVLQPGMTFHFMPGIWMDDWGLEITETILITDDGPAEALASYPRELTVKS
ncbi:MAG: ectoine hydrolase DoeA [Nitriliruptoraceae bacterium]|nr:ectoine hydrolase DoeA [Nitriliruptoraceae bacterium]